MLSLNDNTPNIKYWLFRVCRNLFLDNVRKNEKYADVDNLENMLVTEKTPVDNIVDNIEFVENNPIKALMIHNILASNPFQADLLYQYYLKGSPHLYHWTFLCFPLQIFYQPVC